MRPQLVGKQPKTAIDESTDTYDTIEWLLKRFGYTNGNVGQWGISYPGFYTAVGALCGHPALKASSPQAPIADWYWDDFYHNGAFFLPHAFGFLSGFGRPRPAPTTQVAAGITFPTPDGYDFYYRMGSLSNVKKRYFGDSIAFWNDIVAHPAYDTFWQARSILPHLKNVKHAVLTVGGWYDAEDLFGPLKIYSHLEKNNPKIAYNGLVMGPWVHGGWNRGSGESVGIVHFGSKTAEFYRDSIEYPFFNHYLRGGEPHNLPEAYIFETGTNRWRRFDTWPPTNVEQRRLYFHAGGGSMGGGLAFTPPTRGESMQFISDPGTPVPFTEAVAIGMTREYMTDDQRFAERRPDVLTFRTDTLQDDVTVVGNMMVELIVSTTGTDADFAVKLIDVYPDYHTGYPHNPPHVKTGGCRQMVRSEVFRGRYRNSFEKPEPFQPGVPDTIRIELLDLCHTFQKGHRIMVQVQSTWFPLVDRNPQKYVPNIFEAKEEDFIPATHSVFCGTTHASNIQLRVLKKEQ
jgi:putative CocE/NonD family hydrolase